jgi:hypothetical protein
MPIDTHVRVAAWLHIVMGALVVAFFAFIGLAVSAAGAFGISQGLQPGIAAWIAGFGVLVFGFFIAFAALEIVGGVLLLRGSPAGRVITIIYSVLSLLNIPIGTVVGIYSLWALLRAVPQPVAVPVAAHPGTAQPY